MGYGPRCSSLLFVDPRGVFGPSRLVIAVSPSMGPSSRMVMLLALLVGEEVEGLRDGVVDGAIGGNFGRAIAPFRSSRRVSAASIVSRSAIQNLFMVMWDG